MKETPMKRIFSEKSLKKENDFELNKLWVTILLTCVLFCGSILYAVLRYFVAKRDDPTPLLGSPGGHAAPLVPADLQDVHDLLQSPDEGLCRAWEVLPPFRAEQGQWAQGTSVCTDLLPAVQTPANCRIYSVRYDPDNIAFEIKKGRDGCRVHLWGNFSDYSYSRASQNVYLYPVGIGPTSGPGVFSFDDFVGLLGHEHSRIHLVKATLPGGYRDLLRALYASKTEAWRRINQIQLMVDLPRVRPGGAWRGLEGPHRDLAGLAHLGFRLARSRRDGRGAYRVPAGGGVRMAPEEDGLPFSTLYELVWIRPGAAA